MPKAVRPVLWVAAIALVVAGLWWWSSASAPEYTRSAGARPIKGSVEAAVLIEEYSDFQCPACKASQPLVQQLLQTFGDRVTLSYKHYPLIQIHTQAFRAALAAECANDQGKFWEMHDKLFEVQPKFSRDELVGYAEELGLELDGPQGFSACLDARSRTDIVRSDMREGDQRGVDATPTFFLNGEAVDNYTNLPELIQAKLIGG